jgi:hypothetical protein
MTLPQTTLDKIKKDATDKSYEKVKGSFESPYGRGFRSGYETGHEEAATEWAGKAQGLVDALEQLKEGAPAHTITFIDNALAKYKEVTK